MDQAVIVLAVVGFLMIAAEVFVPGMVLGALGALSLLAAIVAGYIAHGPFGGSIIFAAIALVSGIGFLVWMKTFARTAVGRRIILQTPAAQDTSAATSLVGRSGTAVTALRPAGTARIEGRRIDVIAEGAFIESGTAVTVISQEGLRTVVRPSAGPSTAKRPD